MKTLEGTTLKTFSELDLIEPLQRALFEENYHTPTPIQAHTIPAALDGCDILGCAQTGTGKTAAFALPILDYLGQEEQKVRSNRPLVLVLAPTRELALQIGESFETYGRHLRLRCVLVYGGVNQASQVRALNRGAHVLVATPGRLLDLMNQGYIHLEDLEMFVLDEVDRMLDMGFLPDLKRIIGKLPEERQSMFFSATMPPSIVELSQQLLFDPVSVNVTPKASSVEQIEQQVMFVEKNGKQMLLQNILASPNVDSVIVFTRTKRGANLVAERLQNSGVNSAAIHGNKSQAARQRALGAFKSGRLRVLVATDLAARGIDIDGVTHVINFDLPNEPESYVHRIGRTGRAGAKGIAVSFCSSAERGDLRAIEKLIGKRVPLAPDQLEPQPATTNREGHNNSSRRPRISVHSDQREARDCTGRGSEHSGGSRRSQRRRSGKRNQPAHQVGRRTDAGSNRASASTVASGTANRQTHSEDRPIEKIARNFVKSIATFKPKPRPTNGGRKRLHTKRPR
ncbi:MAG TPA: DEAD/DEAH box helicase [Pirellulaceae bacterium]|nr:DEAD/DEAH box helicase [Pirellulaceae bacterium]HMO94348.1 DEAD/DEAH box helicase [Pirellulaceae bacterium]HMP71442.1 DEAD/DEAH box helicase [Pirellulaceae bacterium]